jgi:hypothetical protein
VTRHLAWGWSTTPSHSVYLCVQRTEQHDTPGGTTGSDECLCAYIATSLAPPLVGLKTMGGNEAAPVLVMLSLVVQDGEKQQHSWKVPCRGRCPLGSMGDRPAAPYSGTWREGSIGFSPHSWWIRREKGRSAFVNITYVDPSAHTFGGKSAMSSRDAQDQRWKLMGLRPVFARAYFLWSFIFKIWTSIQHVNILTVYIKLQIPIFS